MKGEDISGYFCLAGTLIYFFLIQKRSFFRQTQQPQKNLNHEHKIINMAKIFILMKKRSLFLVLRLCHPALIQRIFTGNIESNVLRP